MSKRPTRPRKQADKEAAAAIPAADIRLPQTGGCQCGGIRYEITELPRFAYACHCKQCQRATSSAFSISMIVVEHGFRLSGIEPVSFERPAGEGRSVTRWICPRCGVWICGGKKPGTAAPDALRWIQAGTLDDTSWLRPMAHYWTRSKQPWVTLPAGDQVFETQPF